MLPGPPKLLFFLLVKNYFNNKIIIAPGREFPMNSEMPWTSLAVRGSDVARCLPPVLSGWTQTTRSSLTSPQQQQLWDSTETRRNLSESAV